MRAFKDTDVVLSPDAAERQMVYYHGYACCFLESMMTPFIWMISTSLKTAVEVFKYPIEWILKAINWNHHFKVWSGTKSFVTYYYNSLKVSIISTIGATFLSAFAAYGFSRIEFRGREALFVVYLSMMMVPPQVLFVPKFIMFDWAVFTIRI